MNKFFKTGLIFSILLIFSGCATWQLINTDNLKWKQYYFEAELPEGWVKFNSPVHLLFLTKDGVLLQCITISRHDLDKELPMSKKKIKENMLIQDIASIVVDEMTLNREEYLNLEFLENKPSNIGGIKGFRLIYTFNNKDFMQYRGIAYGFIFKKKYYDIEYLAAKQYYFEKGFLDFESFVNSFKVIKK